MSKMVVLMNLGGITCADLCSVTASTGSARQLILASARLEVSVFLDLAAQASTVRSAACCLQGLGLNLLELTIVAPLVNRKSSGLHKLVPDVGNTDVMVILRLISLHLLISPCQTQSPVS